MSDLNIQNNEQNDIDKVIDSKRRSFTKAGIAAPVIMSLATRPVFGAQCLSDMLSSNLSNHAHQSQCVGGVSPEVLASPSSIATWEQAGFNYGSIPTSKKRILDTQDSKKRVLKEAKLNTVITETLAEWEKYEGGTRYNDSIKGFGGTDDRSFREVLNDPDSSDAAVYIAGLLNASYYDALKVAGLSNESYMFSASEFWQLYNGTLSIPESANMNLKDLIILGYTKG